jgi:RND family efflux transporter MFP subunit
VTATLYVTRWGFTLPNTAPAEHAAILSSPGAVEQKLIFAAGIVEGMTEPLEVRFEVSGCIQEVLVQEGQRVRKNDVLAKLDPEFYELAVRKAESDFHTADLQSQTLAMPGTGRSGLNSSSGNFKNATQTVSDAREVKSNEHAMAIGQATSAELAMQREKIQLEKTQLRSPIDGTIIECALHPGELTGPHERTASFRVVDRSEIRVRAWVEEIDAMDVTIGMPAVAIASGSVDRRYRGTVITCASFMQPRSERHLHPGEKVDVRVREIIVKLDGGHDLLLGLPVEVFLAHGKTSRAGRVPKPSIPHPASESGIPQESR